MALNPNENVWNSYRDLRDITVKYLNQNSSTDLPSADFENVLKRYKQSFFNLLQNPPKNANRREELAKGMQDGIFIKGLGHQILSEEFYREAIEFSNMFDLNELISLDLLCTAQLQQSYYPDLTRGLVGILLYYDGRKALVSSLLYLVQARNGIQWSVNINPELARFVNDYTDQLMNAGLFKRILELLNELDLTTELSKLDQHLALGGFKHKRQVTDLFNDIKEILSEILFTWSMQCGLSKDHIIELIDYLKCVRIESEASGIIDDVNLNLQMTLLSALDLSVFHTREDGEEVIQNLPIIADTTLIGTVVNELLPTNGRWATEVLQALSMFGMAVCLASLKVLPQNYVFQDAINKEDQLIDSAIEMNLFSSLYRIVLDNKKLYTQQYLFRRMHNLFTDFIVYMYPKVKDLRMKANEVARTLQVYYREGLEAPANLPRYFERLLACIGKFYQKNEVDLSLTNEWWDSMHLDTTSDTIVLRQAPRSVALSKFIRLSGEMLPVTLFVPFMSMLRGLATSPDTARLCFNLLKSPGQTISHTVCWEHFLSSFTHYYQNLRQEISPYGETVYRRANFPRNVSPQELEGLHAVLLLMQTVSEHDSFSRSALCEHPAWSPLNTLLGLVSCPIPLLFKAALLDTLAVLSHDESNAYQMWEYLEASQILVTVHTTSSYCPRGIETELDEIESWMEEYPLTKAILKLLDSLLSSDYPPALGAGYRKPGIEPYLEFIINNVFLKFNTRSYKDPGERWEIAVLCLGIFEKILKNYTPQETDFSDENLDLPLGYYIMIQLNSNSGPVHVIFDIIYECTHFFDTYYSFKGQEHIEKSAQLALSILHRALMLQDRFCAAIIISPLSCILVSLSKLLLSNNRRTRSPDHCISIAKYVSYQPYLPKLACLALKVLLNLTNVPTNHNLLIKILDTSPEANLLIRSGFRQCLDAASDNDFFSPIECIKRDILRIMRHCLNFASPNLTHFILGFDFGIPLHLNEFRYPGVQGYPRTCFHSLLAILNRVVSPSAPDRPNSYLLESAYHTLYRLAANATTSEPVLKFLRINKQFFISHLKEARKTMKNDVRCLRQMSWLLKTLAIELKVASEQKQLTYLKQIVSFLGNAPSSNNEEIIDDETMFLHQILFLHIHEIEDIPMMEEGEGLIHHASRPSSGTTDSDVSDRDVQMQKRNDAWIVLDEFVHAWELVTEILVTYVPLEVLDAKGQQEFSISLASCILKKITQESSLVLEISKLLSNCILLLLNNIKKHYLSGQKTFNVLSYHMGSLKEIIDGLAQWILNSSAEDTELRINLYTTLMCFLQFANIQTTETHQLINSRAPFTELTIHSINLARIISTSPPPPPPSPSPSASAPARGSPQISKEVFANFGPNLIELLCRDCMGGHNACTILALACLSRLVTNEPNLTYFKQIATSGFVNRIVESIIDTEMELTALLETGTENLKASYTYLGRMMLLIHVAGTKFGANLIVNEKLLHCFAAMRIYKVHPEMRRVWSDGQNNGINFLPAIDELYLQLFMPILKFINALLTTLGTENELLIESIMYFLISNMEVMELILRSGDTKLSLSSLKELSALTSLIARSANNNLINIMESPHIVYTSRAHIYRIQKLMFNLIPKFIFTEDNVRNLCMTPELETVPCPTSDRLLFGLQIATNLLGYSTNVICNNDVEHEGVGVLFYPVLRDPQLEFSSQNSSTSNVIGGNSTPREQEATLGVIVQQLIHTVDLHQQSKLALSLLNRKLNEIHEMPSGELQPLINNNINNDNDNNSMSNISDGSEEITNINLKRAKAFDNMMVHIAKKEKEMNYCGYIIEHCLVLIWLHLDFYMLKAVPIPRDSTISSVNFAAISNAPATAAIVDPETIDVSLPAPSDAVWKVSSEIVENLKQGFVALFNDSFSKKLLEAAENRTEHERGLIEVLLRKIKRLLQFVREF